MAQVGSDGGIVIRQALDATDPVFANSPDLIVTGTTAAFDPGSFTDPDAYGWYFSQAPVPGSANYLYVRGVNETSTGTQRSRVFLYCATGDQLLDPAQWQSSGFTVGGTAQNYVTLRAISLHQLVATDPPVQWTPPKRPAAARRTSSSPGSTTPRTPSRHAGRRRRSPT